VSLIDIAPTLVSAAGDTSQQFDSARSLISPTEPDREIYAETEYPRVAGWSPVRTLVRDRWKAVATRSVELYDLGADPEEKHNLAASRAAMVSTMSARLAALRAANTAIAARTVSTETAEKLRALGYIAGGSAHVSADAPNPADHIAAWATFEAALADLGKRRSGATAQLKRLANAYPDAAIFQSTYARALSESGSHREALSIYRRAAARWPDDAMLFHELAVAARAAGQASEALRSEQAALAVDPALSAAHNGVGLLMTDAGRHRDAATAFDRAVRFDPTNGEYWVNLGNARRAAGDLNGGADAYRRASDIDPSSADAANGLGVLLVQQQRAAEAIPMFERALATSPDFIEARLNLAIACQESGQGERAIGLYREVLARAKPGTRERRAAADLLRSLGR
jgi:tetratricopeptide (TPR) repeat protein